MNARRKARATGRVVWSISWEGLERAGEDRIVERDGQFYYYGDDGDEGGPYPSLDEAVNKHHLHFAAFGTYSIDCPILPAAEVAYMLIPEWDGAETGQEVWINGERWVCDKSSVFRRAVKDKRSQR